MHNGKGTFMRILIVEDDLFTVKYISYILNGTEYQPVHGYQEQQIMDSIQRDEPGLVLLDVDMPNMSGFDICRRIRTVSDVPIIFVSGMKELEDRVQGLRSGGDDYIVKPFEPSELLARISAVLRRVSRSDTPAPTRHGQITLDPVLQTASFNSQSVDLTSIEFQMLSFLMENCGKLVSASHIVEHVWGTENQMSSNVVAVYISRLRTKLSKYGGRHQYIVTVPNQGYCFETGD